MSNEQTTFVRNWRHVRAVNTCGLKSTTIMASTCILVLVSMSTCQAPSSRSSFSKIGFFSSSFMVFVLVRAGDFGTHKFEIIG